MSPPHPASPMGATRKGLGLTWILLRDCGMLLFSFSIFTPKRTKAVPSSFFPYRYLEENRTGKSGCHMMAFQSPFKTRLHYWNICPMMDHNKERWTISGRHMDKVNLDHRKAGLEGTSQGLIQTPAPGRITPE